MYLGAMLRLCTLLFVALFCGQLSAQSGHEYDVPKADKAPVIDGDPSDPAWTNATWYPMDQVWVGEAPSPEDFQGRFKLTWDKGHLYVLAEIVDEKLIDIHPDPLHDYWKDDCLEIFVDENASRGNHQFNHNAFAYHCALDGQIADLDSDKNVKLFLDAGQARWKAIGGKFYWEVELHLFADTYVVGAQNKFLKLKAGKNIGFAIAYCDNDNSLDRENFVGSEVIDAEDKDLGWIDAGVFGTAILRD